MPHAKLWSLWTALLVSLTFGLMVGMVEAAEGYATYYTVASCQREGTSGVWTANGERYQENALTCALPSRQFGQRVQVCGKQTGTCLTLRQNDYGPGKKARSRGVIVDLTPTAFQQVCGALRQGRCQVVLTAIPAP